jgi:hypothetical protein
VPILLIDLALGAVLVATIALAARRAPVGSSRAGRWLVGSLLIAVPLPLAVGVQVLAPLPPPLGEGSFVAGLAAFAAGALLVLGRDDEDDLRGDSEREHPPWWPEFERDFRAYAKRSSRPRVPS